jgi:hypothetical protein
MKNFIKATLLAASLLVAPSAFADGFIMSVDIKGDNVDIALVIAAESERPIMNLNRFIEINVGTHPWLSGADLKTPIPKGLSVDIELL